MRIQPSKEAVREFQKLFAEEFDEALPFAQAELMAAEVLQLFHLLLVEQPQNQTAIQIPPFSVN